jgi:hypothetical protein
MKTLIKELSGHPKNLTTFIKLRQSETPVTKIHNADFSMLLSYDYEITKPRSKD